jgi:hypothetical protein
MSNLTADDYNQASSALWRAWDLISLAAPLGALKYDEKSTELLNAVATDFSFLLAYLEGRQHDLTEEKQE